MILVGVNYKINNKYSKFKFKYGHDDYSDVSGAIINIYGDGNLIFTSGKIDIQEDAKAAEIDVKGVKILTISFSGRKSALIVADPVLIP